MFGIVLQLASHSGKKNSTVEREKDKTRFGSRLTPRACSLEIQQVAVRSQLCGLLKSKTKQPLLGLSLVARIKKLHRNLTGAWKPSLCARREETRRGEFIRRHM